jgi:hypothetical protein
VLCSPEFVSFREPAGPLDDHALASRLSYFLWNSPPDDMLRDRVDSGRGFDQPVLRRECDRMLDDPRSERFIRAFLDYWLDLRRATATSPDERLYPDYYLDDLLVDSAIEETRLFFTSLIREDLPVRHLVDADFTFLNQRLARHYGLPPVDGVRLRRVELPEDSCRGGLLTQASVLKVTADGSTTSPVVRGAWVMERILGQKPPTPPPNVPAIEPDTRGATTIRQQLALHRSVESCNQCHAMIDPAGFALENFDVLGGWRDRYRVSLDPDAEQGPAKTSGFESPGEGYGKNGQPFQFVYGPQVDASGQLIGVGAFADIHQFKDLLGQRDRMLAGNLVRQFVIYATGAPIRFADREEIEEILDATEPRGYPIRSLIHQVVQSDMFQMK